LNVVTTPVAVFVVVVAGLVSGCALGLWGWGGGRAGEMEGGSPSPDNVGVDGGGDMYTTRRVPAPHGRDDPLLVVL